MIITTQYQWPTERRGARVKASAEGYPHSVFVSCGFGPPAPEAHRKAAEKLAAKLRVKIDPSIIPLASCNRCPCE
jgi:hypothetical protein